MLEMVERSCASGAACHGGGEGQGQLSFERALATGDLRQVLVDVAACQYDRLPRVAPGKPELSWLWIKLQESHGGGGVDFTPSPNWQPRLLADEDGRYPLSQCPLTRDGEIVFGQAMPMGTPLSSEDLMLVHDWILAGAPGPEEAAKEDAGPEPNECADVGDQVTLELGAHDPSLGFADLEDGGEIPLSTFGQGGRVVNLAMRVRGPLDGSTPVTIILSRVDTGASLMWDDAGAELLCLDDGFQYLERISIGPARLGPVESLDGVEVDVQLSVTDRHGKVHSVQKRGVLAAK